VPHDLLPRWVYQLIEAVEQYESVHGKDWPHCFDRTLSLVPDQERDRANILAYYGAQVPQE
jgi:hypothetical protein